MPPQAQAKEQIQALIEKYKALTASQISDLAETTVVNQYIVPLFTALGWPTQDAGRFQYEVNTYAGRPDMVLTPDQGGTLYVEAKRFGKIKELKEARKTISGIVTPGQLALPGMATDRTPEEQQAINYAFENGGTWAMLTNFEKLRLFNARRDWLVLSFETPSVYLDEFDLLWQLSYDNLRQGSLDALSNQRHREDVDTDYLNFINEWRERLAQDIVSRPQANPWAFGSDGQLLLDKLRAVVQRVLDRLVVVRFAEDHLIMPAGTLQSFYELSVTNPYTFSLSEFFQKLCRRFDAAHNSALFASHAADRAVFSDDVLGPLVAKLYEARYRAMSADIMGNTYEQYLGKALVATGNLRGLHQGDSLSKGAAQDLEGLEKEDGAPENLRGLHQGDSLSRGAAQDLEGLGEGITITTADNLETRKKQGSYYTPQVIVRYLVDNSLGRYLYATANGQPDGEPLPDAQPKTAVDIADLRVIDPACGSGGFLIYAYQVLADFYRREIARLKAARDARYDELVAEGVTMPMDIRIELTPWRTAIERLRNYPRLILETHLYGVDLDPQAAEIATVNLIMRAMADMPRSEKRLPLILNQNIKVGNSLIGAGPDDPRYADHSETLAELARLRRKIAAEAALPEEPADHDETVARITALTMELNAVLDADLQDHFDDPAAHHPFNWGVEFPEVFFPESGGNDADEDAGGFDVVIGNPPWEIVKPDLREYYAQFDPDIESKLTRKKAEKRIKELDAADPARKVGWQAQKARIEAAAAYYKSSDTYTRQGRGDTATHKLFTERGYNILTKGGRIGYIIPSGIYTDLGTKELREMLLNSGQIETLVSLTNGVSGGDAYFYDIHRSFKITLLIAIRGVLAKDFRAVFKIDPRDVPKPQKLIDFLSDSEQFMTIKVPMLKRFSPESLSLMEFREKRDYDVTEKIYDDHPVLGEESTWDINLSSEFHMTNDRHLFNQNSSLAFRLNN